MDSAAGGAWTLGADGRTAILAIGPFRVGVTSSSTTNLGRQTSAGTITSFPIYDSVPAVLTSARVGYASVNGVPDTLHVSWSEPILWTGADPLVYIQSKGAITVVKGSLTVVAGDNLGGAILLDPKDSSLTVFRKGDLVRLAPKSAGTQTDAFGNAAEDPTRWVPVVLGRRPPRFQVVFDPNKIRYKDWGMDAGPALQIWVKSANEKTWVDFSTGLEIPADRVVQGARSHDLLEPALAWQGDPLRQPGNLRGEDRPRSPLPTSSTRTVIPKDASNQYDVRVQWNGKAEGGQPAASGVYMMRLVMWQNASLAEDEAPRLAGREQHLPPWMGCTRQVNGSGMRRTRRPAGFRVLLAFVQCSEGGASFCCSVTESTVSQQAKSTTCALCQ